jgi:cyanate lyase
MLKLFEKLRRALKNMDITYADVAAAIGRQSSMYVSNCLNGKSQFSQGEMYAILHMIGAERCELHEYFPEDGIIQLEKKKEPSFDGVVISRDAYEILRTIVLKADEGRRAVK